MCRIVSLLFFGGTLFSAVLILLKRLEEAIVGQEGELFSAEMGYHGCIILRDSACASPA